MAAEILIVDDEADIRDLVAGILQDEGYGTRTARNSDEALAAVATRRPNLVFLDIWLQGSKLDGLQLLDAVKQEHPELPVVMIPGHCSRRHQTRCLRFYRETIQSRSARVGR
jgi:two-component system nitrogen regulation response regulator NtrX